MKLFQQSLIITIAVSFSAIGLSQEENLKIGLVLSGGGAKALAHIGVLKVLEETGIKIDFIGGTSMGSIVGGLYACGYNAAEIEKIAMEQDWDKLIFDRISRKDLLQEEKDNKSRYLAELQFYDGKPHLPSGIVAGHNISNLLIDLTCHVSEINDFTHLPIPFLCIGTDIETGESVTLNKGFLPDAMRASMAIPSIFTPVPWGECLLIDGGFVNNFPVKEVVDMGADIIIGVYVGYQPRDKEELNTLTKIVGQSMFYNSNSLTAENTSLCNIYIEPQISEYGTGDFHDVDSLITRGERAARTIWPELIELSNKIQTDNSKDFHEQKIEKKDSFYITEIEISNLNQVPQRLIDSRVRFSLPDTICKKELKYVIDQLYGTQYFESVTYKIENTNTGKKLIIRPQEKELKALKLGLHYDSDLKSCIRINGIFRNVGIKGSRLMLRGGLGDNLRYEADYFINTSMRPNYDFRFRFQGDYIDIFDYDGDKIIQKFKLFNHTFDMIDQLTYRNSYTFGGGLQFQFTSMNLIYGTDDYNWPNYDLFNVLFFMHIDTQDKPVFPKKGMQLFSEYKLVSNQKDAFQRINIGHTCYSTFKGVVPLSKKIQLLPQYYFSVVLSDSVPNNYLSALGGDNLLKRPIFPFIGYRYTEIVNKNFATARLDLQMEIFNKNYIILKSNIGKHAYHLKNLHDAPFIKGYGITYGIETLTGPIELTLMTRDFSKNTFLSARIGYNF